MIKMNSIFFFYFKWKRESLTHEAIIRNFEKWEQNYNTNRWCYADPSTAIYKKDWSFEKKTTTQCINLYKTHSDNNVYQACWYQFLRVIYYNKRFSHNSHSGPIHRKHVNISANTKTL